VQEDAPADLYARPRHAFAARFIGAPAMNLMPLEPGPDGPVVAGTDFAPGAPDGATQFGVRPEALRPAAQGLPVIVESQDYLGAETLALCRAGTTRIALRLPSASAPLPGTRLALGWAPEDAHFFRADDSRIEPAGAAPMARAAPRTLIPNMEH
jgi:sn-glycerol 3-phosphate transport system ATP-binding protein